MSDFKAKMNQIHFRLGQTLLGELTALPQTNSWILGAYFSGRGKEECRDPLYVFLQIYTHTPGICHTYTRTNQSPHTMYSFLVQKRLTKWVLADTFHYLRIYTKILQRLPLTLLGKFTILLAGVGGHLVDG